MQPAEAKKMVEALQTAIQMEVDGRKFYQQASQKSSSKLAKKLFEELASEEDEHRRKFEEIYEEVKKGHDWPAAEPPSERGKRIKSIFTEATKELGKKVKVAESELEAITTSMNMEIKTYDLYRSRAEQSTIPVEKRFYEALAAEERGHHLALLDSYEYFTDPAGWYVMKQHHLDGI